MSFRRPRAGAIVILSGLSFAVHAAGQPGPKAAPTEGSLPSDTLLLTMPVTEQVRASRNSDFVCPTNVRSEQFFADADTEPLVATVSSEYFSENPEHRFEGYDSYASCVYTLEVKSMSGKKLYKERFRWGPKWAFKRQMRTSIGSDGNTTVALVSLGQKNRKFLLIDAKGFDHSNGVGVVRIVDFAGLRRRYLLDIWQRSGFVVKIDDSAVSLSGRYVGNGSMAEAKPMTVKLEYSALRNVLEPLGRGLEYAFMAEKSSREHVIEKDQVGFSDDWIGQLIDPSFCAKMSSATIARMSHGNLQDASIEYLPKDYGLRFITAVGLDGRGIDGVILLRQEFSPNVTILWSKQGCHDGEIKMSKEKLYSLLKYIRFPLKGEDLDHGGLPALPAPPRGSH